jgi:hypothetical protein
MTAGRSNREAKSAQVRITHASQNEGEIRADDEEDYDVQLGEDLSSKDKHLEHPADARGRCGTTYLEEDVARAEKGVLSSLRLRGRLTKHKVEKLSV